MSDDAATGRDEETGRFTEGNDLGKEGRPTTYKPEYVEQARKLCSVFGAIDADLAEFFGVSDRTIRRWKNDYPEFHAALDVGKEVADKRVEQALYHRAIGYSHEAVRMHVVEGEVVQTPYIEQLPPDTPAAKLWLMNRCGWTDKVNLEHTGKGGGPIESKIDMTGLSDDQLRALASIKLPGE